MWRASSSVPAMPPIMASTPTPRGRRAATTEPKASNRKTTTTGRITSSARLRSRLATSTKSWLMASMPAPTTSRVRDCTLARREAYTSDDTEENPRVTRPDARTASSTRTRARWPSRESMAGSGGPTSYGERTRATRGRAVNRAGARWTTSRAARARATRVAAVEQGEAGLPVPRGPVRVSAPASQDRPDLKEAAHEYRRVHVLHRLRDSYRRACPRGRGARLRIALGARAHSHPDESPDPVPRRQPAPQGIRAHLRPFRLAHGRRRRDQATPDRHRHLPGHRARHHHHGQGGGEPRRAVGRALRVRHRGRMERRGDGEPRRRIRHTLQEAARAGLGHEGDLDKG